MVKKIGRYAADSIEELLLLKSTILRDSFVENYLVGDTMSIRFTVGQDNLKEGEVRKVLHKEGIDFIESMFLALASKMFFPKNYGESVSAYAYSIEENVKSLEKLVREFFEIMTDPDRDMKAFPDMYSFIGNFSFSDYSINDKMVTVQIDEKDISAIPFRDLIKPGVFDFLVAVSKGLKGIFSNLKNLELIYCEAMRANSRRLYSNEDQGTVFNSLLVQLRNNPLDQYKLQFVNKWIKEFELADEFFVEGLEGVASRVTLRKGERLLTLADLGYGITQLLPIILNIAFYSESFEEEFEKNPPRKLMLIEEPESNLHPALQSKLADLFIDAYRKFKVQFIIETHSEYLIRKLQYLTATKEITPDDTAVYYLYDPANIPEGEPQVKRLNILPDGRLDGQFGPGFFDETARLIIGTLTGENLN